MEPTDKLTLESFPAAFAGFAPNRMLFKNDSLYLVNTNKMTFVQVTADGTFVQGRELGALIDLEEREKEDLGIGGFDVDGAGRFYFTMPVVARVYRVGTDGSVSSFGKRGSAPGKFGVISDIAVDAAGNCLVSDRLRCVVLVFDEDFRFVAEFGGRSWRRPEGMISPGSLSFDAVNRLYVSLMGRRGVNVYQLGVP